MGKENYKYRYQAIPINNIALIGYYGLYSLLTGTRKGLSDFD